MSIPRYICMSGRHDNHYTAMLKKKTWTNMRYFNWSVYALATLRDIYHYRINCQRLVMHRRVWTHIAIPKEGYKITASAIFDVWSWNKAAARRTRARNAFIVTADVKWTGDTFMSTQFIHKIYVVLIKNLRIILHIR